MNPLSSLQHTDGIITVASWEERFLLGLAHLIRTIRPSWILMFHYEEYADWSNGNRQEIARICGQQGIELRNGRVLSFNSPVESWKTLVAEVGLAVVPRGAITLDISTMPRETIWSTCHVLASQGITIQYTYHRPGTYGDWLSRDPGKPRILYKQAGLNHLGRGVALVIQTGYDIERVKQLERFFEPDRVLLGLQTGKQLRNPEQNRQKHENAFAARRHIEVFDIDGYSLNETYLTIEEKINSLLDSYNIVLSSLGPKIGALALYKIKQTFPEVALCYAPSNEFNREYSQGIGDCIHGMLNAMQCRSEPA